MNDRTHEVRARRRALAGFLSAGAAILALLLSPSTALAGGSAGPADSARATEVMLTGVVNINTASAQELQLLPGIGEPRARAVIEQRKRRGGFKRVEELLEVKGIGEARLSKLRRHLAVSGKTTAQLAARQ